MFNNITDVPGIEVGHAENKRVSLAAPLRFLY